MPVSNCHRTLSTWTSPRSADRPVWSLVHRWARVVERSFAAPKQLRGGPLDPVGYELCTPEGGKGGGVRATRGFQVGETVMIGVLEGEVACNDSHATQVSRTKWARHGGLGPMVNHSCSPNCGVELNETGACDFVARRSISDRRGDHFRLRDAQLLDRALSGWLPLRGGHLPRLGDRLEGSLRPSAKPTTRAWSRPTCSRSIASWPAQSSDASGRTSPGRQAWSRNWPPTPPNLAEPLACPACRQYVALALWGWRAAKLGGGGAQRPNACAGYSPSGTGSKSGR